MNVLILGSGGREHAIFEKIRESSSAEKIFCIPGNAGINDSAITADIAVSNHRELIDFAKSNNIELTIIGPENPLTRGIVNDFESEGLTIFGPSREASILEASKAYSKELMRKYGIPTAEYKIFTDHTDAENYLRSHTHPIVVKASGLAAGKGAKVCTDLEQSLKAIREIMVEKCFKDAGDEVVIEEFMKGEEASVFAISDGNYYKILAPAQDHKAVYDGDRGPNTGGMGSYAPAPLIDDKMMYIIERSIIEPTLEAMKAEGRPYKGVLFVGLMITDSGPKVIEYNCRFGDPETQVILPLLDADLLELLYDSAKGRFAENGILPLKNKHSLCLVLASGGYPGKYFTGYEITGLGSISNSKVLHAGTVLENNKTVTGGGRVLNVVCTADSLREAKKGAYRDAENIKFKDMYFRKDIGDKGVKYYEK
ncbi:MAG TPA: phosphoribosylamine--glycine ligase [Clostridiales bacterium]|nr:phosphoribosylamine--glycine ligase [Clostridiales bacterium]HQP70168.1 phosphoribosylamine--glycine ligase [Clostridiales bacterium]